MSQRKGDVITTSKGPAAIEDGEPEVAPAFSGSGDRDWTDVHNRLMQVSGVNINNFGTIEYSEDGGDVKESELEVSFNEAGAPTGAGTAVAKAANQMGVGVKFTARKAAEPEAEADEAS